MFLCAILFLLSLTASSLGLFAGAIGFIGTSMFVKRIYTMIKGD